MRLVAAALLLVAFGANAQTFTASVTTGPSPLATVLTWNVPGAATCTAAGGSAWTGSVPTSGTRPFTGIKSPLHLTLDCKAADGLGLAVLNWIAPTTNTDGSALSNLAGYKIAYSKGTTLDQNIDVPNPSAITYTVNSLTAGTWFFTVSAATSTCFPTPAPVTCHVSAPTNSVSKAVVVTPGATLPQLSVDLAPFTVPNPPTGLTVTDPNQIAYEIKSTNGVLSARQIGYVAMGSDCELAQIRKVGTTTYARIAQLKPFYVGQIDFFVSATKLQDAFAKCG